MMEVKAYAKVNIGLKVCAKRPDGYHDIDSHFMLIPLYDTLFLDIEEGPLSIDVEGNEGYLEKGKKDLMAKAAEIYAKESGKSFHIYIRIKKEIPNQAGLGGGSSDAATVLRVLNERYQVFTAEELIRIAAKVGADVPFFVSGYQFARVNGIGDVVVEEKVHLPYSWISLYRAVGSGVSTKEAYEKLDAEVRDASPLPPLEGYLDRASFPNDFEKLEGTLMYSLVKDKVEETAYISLSGSGSVWFVLSSGPLEKDCPEFLASKKLFSVD